MIPKISVCLLTYNHDHTLHSVIQSIIEQTFFDFELIINDDNSTDNSWEIIIKYAGSDKRIIPVRNNSNLGMPTNANKAFGIAKGKYIALLNHDDLFDKTLLEKWLSVIESDQTIAFVFNDYLVNGKYPSHKSEKRDFKTKMEGKVFFDKYLINKWGSPVRASALIRRECLKKVKGMDESFGLLADVDLWMRLASNWNVGYVNEPLISVYSNRKHNYPEIYTEWSWKRLLILFEIHAANLKRVYKDNFIKWFLFRAKVSIEIIKWLSYGVVRKKYFIIKQSDEAKNNYEFLFVKLFKSLLKKLYR